MTVYESDLPGVGKKHEIDLGGGARLVVVTHNTGKREVFRRSTPDGDSEKLFELSDDLARQVGTILEGAYFQPVRSSTIETVLGANTVLEWVEVHEGSELTGKTLAEADIRQRFAASVIAIERDDEVLSNPAGETEIRSGDILIVIGSRDSCRSFESFVSGT